MLCFATLAYDRGSGRNNRTLTLENSKHREVNVCVEAEMCLPNQNREALHN